MKHLIAIMAGDGIGPEIMPQAVAVLRALSRHGVELDLQEVPIRGPGPGVLDSDLPASSWDMVQRADAILFGAIGGSESTSLLEPSRRKSALLQMRKGLNLFANLRPVQLMPGLESISPLRPERLQGLDIMIVRELTGDLYFGEPRGVSGMAGARSGVNTMRYDETEIERIAHFAFRLARTRRSTLCSVDKANVLETMALWRDVVTQVGLAYPDVALSHLYVDAAAMELLKRPASFDVMLCGNLFGDILSDEASMLTGSIGLLPSASVGEGTKGFYEPIHGSAPDIAGQDIANPLGTILSAAMMLRHSLNQAAAAHRVEAAVARVLANGLRTADIMQDGMRRVGCAEMGRAVVAAL